MKFADKNAKSNLQVLATYVAQFENKVLHSQLNSHFIFNILNWVKAHISEKDVTKAVTYLNKFSKLMRQWNAAQKYSPIV